LGVDEEATVSPAPGGDLSPESGSGRQARGRRAKGAAPGVEPGESPLRAPEPETGAETPPIDLIVFGPHPDDCEIGLGGTIALHVARGFSVGLCDLTAGEMGSNGTPDVRLAEAEAARATLGAAWRLNLRWDDRRIGKDPAHLEEAVAFLRRHRPRTVAAPHWCDRHPDHAAASAVLTEAVFSAGLRRYAPSAGDAWKVDWICYYFINDSVPPSFVVDVSDYYDRKRAALECHMSQFQPPDPLLRDEKVVATRLNSPLFRQLVESRDAQFGATAGVRWAEGLVVREPIVRRHLLRGFK
jgi:bacillithiol biosynthesis deacetylase BshB1